LDTPTCIWKRKLIFYCIWKCKLLLIFLLHMEMQFLFSFEGWGYLEFETPSVQGTIQNGIPNVGASHIGLRGLFHVHVTMIVCLHGCPSWETHTQLLGAL
jgi:hypothetical protein